MDLHKNVNDHIFDAIEISRFRIEKFKKLDHAARIFEKFVERNDLYEELLSGSSAEGTYIPDDLAIKPILSDQDMMYVWKIMLVGKTTSLFEALDVEQKTCSLKTSTLKSYFNELTTKIGSSIIPNDHDNLQLHELIATEYRSAKMVIDIEDWDGHCHPGYLKLIATKDFEDLRNIIWKKSSKDRYTINSIIHSQKTVIKNGVPYLSSGEHLDLSNKYWSNFYTRYNTPTNNLRSQGPALDVSPNVYLPLETMNSCINDAKLQEPRVTGIDVVPAFRCPYWPRSALTMLTRETNSGKPSKKQKAKLFLQGCLIVPTYHKPTTSGGIEWRYSFSEIELQLCNSWTQTQLFCYIILKLLKSYYFKDLGISSYHLKTCVFWEIETSDECLWLKKNFIRSIHTVLSILKECLVEKHFPNYFIPSNNMIDHVSIEDIRLLLTKLTPVIEDLLIHIWCCINPVFKNENSYSDLYNQTYLNTANNEYFFNTVLIGHFWTKYRSCLQHRLIACRSTVELVTTLQKAVDNFECYLSIQSHKKNDDVNFQTFLQLLKAWYGHFYFLLAMLQSLNITTFNKLIHKAENLFKESLQFSSSTGFIQLALFYVVCEKFEEASHIVNLVSIAELNCHESYVGVDILLTQTEMQFYKLADQLLTTRVSMWRFHSKVFLKFLKTTIFIRLHDFRNGYDSMVDFHKCIKQMEKEGASPIYLHTNKHLARLIDSLI